MDTSHLQQAVKDYLVNARETALYYNRTTIADNARYLKSLSCSSVQFIFPVKSFPHPEVLAAVSPWLQGFDVSNQSEMELARPWVKPSDTIWNSAPYMCELKTESNVIHDVQRLGSQPPVKGRYSLRVNTDFLGVGKSRFGVELSELTEKNCRDHQIAALHLHHGFERTTLETMKQLIEIMAPHVRASVQLESINLGGGLALLCRQEMSTLVEMSIAALSGKSVFFEPGRWLTRGAGLCVGRVLELVERREGVFAVTSISRDCHLKWAPHNFRLRILPQFEGSARKSEWIAVTGPTCDENDCLATVSRPGQSIAVGDLVIVEDISGYSCAWNQSFNGIRPADLVFLGG